MPQVRGREAVKTFIAELPGQTRKMLRGAARAAANVVAEEAKVRSISSEVDAAIKVATKVEETRVIAMVQVKGDGAYIGPWLEYGTAKHFISVDELQRGGRSVARINDLAVQPGRSHSLVIGGRFVGSTVLHPGARPHPFLRPALDTKEGEAVKAAQAYINARVSPRGMAGSSEGDDE